MKKTFLILIFCLLGYQAFAQTDLTGNWNTGEQNTLIKIYAKEGVYLGEIISSDNPNAKIGRQILKDVELKEGKFKGKVYSPKKKQWFDAEINREDNTLKITISQGLLSKTIEWKKDK